MAFDAPSVAPVTSGEPGAQPAPQTQVRVPKDEAAPDPLAKLLEEAQAAARAREREREPVRGRVVDLDGIPVYHARVGFLLPDERLDLDADEVGSLREALSRHSRSVTTDSQGLFQLPPLPSGTRLRVSAREFLGCTVPLVRPPEGEELLITLTPTREVWVTIIDGLSGLPVEGAQAEVRSGSFKRSVASKADGAVKVRVGPDPITMFITHKERVSRLWREEADSTFVVLDPGRAVRGQILQPDGVPVGADRAVAVVGFAQRRSPHLTRTGPDGYFELPGGIALFEQFAVFSWEQANASELEYEWHPASADNVRVLLSPRGGVEVVGGGGPPEGTLLRPQPAGPVKLDPNGVKFQSWNATHLSFQGLAPGSYVMHGTAPNERCGSAFVVRPGETTVVEWPAAPPDPAVSVTAPSPPAAPAPASAAEDPLPQTSTLRGRIEPAGEVELRLVQDQIERVSARTGPDGRFTLLGLSAGDYTLTVTREGDVLVSQLVRLPLMGELTIRLP